MNSPSTRRNGVHKCASECSVHRSTSIRGEKVVSTVAVGDIASKVNGSGSNICTQIGEDTGLVSTVLSALRNSAVTPGVPSSSTIAKAVESVNADSTVLTSPWAKFNLTQRTKVKEWAVAFVWCDASA